MLFSGPIVEKVTHARHIGAMESRTAAQRVLSVTQRTLQHFE
jgi:hypothetical protein